MNILYICYDGLTDMIGQSQVLPYLVGCARAGHSVTVISFEKASIASKLRGEIQVVCKTNNIVWKPQRFRESPPYISKFLDQLTMRRAAFRAVAASVRPFDLIHCRSYPAALVGAALKRRTGTKLLFDMRGFWPDQRRDGGRWATTSLIGRTLYRRWKKHEAAIVAQSDHIVVLTHAARDIVAEWLAHRGTPISVIPCCADFDLFHPASPTARLAARRELGMPENAPVLGYLGSLGTVYLGGEHIRLFDAIRRINRNARMLFVGRVTPAEISAEATRQGVVLAPDDFRAISSERAQVPYWIGAMDVGTCFIVPDWSSRGVSPTKLGECLACGVPVIANHGIGDVGETVAATDGGHMVDGFSADEIQLAAKAFFELSARDRDGLSAKARSMLDLPLAVAAYDRIYRDPAKAVDLGGAP